MSSICHCKSPNFCVSLRPSFISSSSMEVSFLLHISTIMNTPQSHPSLFRLSTKSSAPRCSLNPKFPSRPGMRKTSLKSSPNLNPKFPSRPGVEKISLKSSSKSVLPRDRIISFGKHKGKRLGTLPSSYLKWVCKSLKRTQFESWALLAEEVLNDPVYGDRIEWEYVQRIMEGDFGSNRIDRIGEHDVATVIDETAEKFDWDMKDKVGWSEVDLGLLGTSYGGRIPRKKEGKEWWSTREKFSKAASDAEEAAAVGGDRRRERRERRERRMLESERELGVAVGLGRRERVVVERDGELGVTTEEESRSDGDDQLVLGKSQYPKLENGGRFPGRESLFKKVINNRKRLS